MKTFKQHVKEYKGYAGDAQGIGTVQILLKMVL